MALSTATPGTWSGCSARSIPWNVLCEWPSFRQEGYGLRRQDEWRGRASPRPSEGCIAVTVLAFSNEEAVWSGTEMRAVDPSSLGAVLRVAEAPPVDSFSSAFADDARQLARTHSGSAAATARLAQAELNADQPEAALAAARQAIDLAKSAGDESALSVAAQVLAVLGEWKSAKEALGEIGNEPYWRLLDAAWLIQEGDATRALERLKGLDTIDGLALRGWLSIKQSDYSRAIRDFRLALRKGSRNPSLLTNLGYAHAATGAMEKAVGETREALRLAPSSKTAGLNLVFYLSACGDFDRAL